MHHMRSQVILLLSESVRGSPRLFFILLLLTVMIMLYISIGAKSNPAHPPYSLSKRYITFNWEDGRRIGNLMFNYASLLGIAEVNNMVPVVPPSFPLHSTFTLGILNNGVRPLFYIEYEEHRRRACTYDRLTKSLPYPYEVVLNGYYQSWKYFEGIEDQVRKHFTPLPNIKKAADDFMRKHFDDRTNVVRVGIHNRRGDIAHKPDKVKYGYTVADETYFKKAMAYFKERYSDVVFIVCSDEMEWSKTHIVGDNVIYSQGHTAEEDFVILASCDHVIVSVGSYGWWAAWLANGTTLYYNQWPRPHTGLDRDVNKREYFPPHWIPMS